MFQSFKVTSNRENGPERLALLRKAMSDAGVSMFLVPHADEHQNEYLPTRSERLSWLTGFSGSAGFAIASQEGCSVFVDGRYTLQVREQVDTEHFQPDDLVGNPPSKWLAKNTTNKDIVGFDPWLITYKQIEAFEKACAKTGAELRPCENLIDRIWEDQPAPPQGDVFLHPEELAGRDAASKIAEVQKVIEDKQCALTVLTDPASLAWLFNIRGSDVVHNPLPLGFAIIPAEGKPRLYMKPEKLLPETASALEKVCLVYPQNQLTEHLAELSAKATILCDTAQMAVALTTIIEEAGGTIIAGRDPVILPRAIKNAAEIKGARDAHLRDGVAMVKFLHWLDAQNPSALDEISTAKRLEQCRSDAARQMGSELREISFDTISGSGPNGAIVHYRVNETSNRTFESNTLYLVDSGGQYPDGTTDITRTIAIGTPPSQAITDFTLVLKGHIGIATACFPKGTRGVDIDILARLPLWRHGKDFAHGTGHGVGSYLNVHEGPQSISKRSMEPLLPGMIISNEPGFYAEGQYGIRIENLVLVTEAEEQDSGTIPVHRFENLTWCPIDLRLVDAQLLNEDEKAWLNTYHAEVLERLSPHLDEAELDWLKIATRAI